MSENAHTEVDPWMVEKLVEGMTLGLQQACVKDLTTPAEVLSAVFTILDRTLGAVRIVEDPADDEFNRKEIAAILQNMLLEYGSRLN